MDLLLMRFLETTVRSSPQINLRKIMCLYKLIADYNDAKIGTEKYSKGTRRVMMWCEKSSAYIRRTEGLGMYNHTLVRHCSLHDDP